MKKEKNGMLIIFIVLCIILVLMSVGYFGYQYIDKKKAQESADNNTKINDAKKITYTAPEGEKLNTSDSLVSSLYKFLGQEKVLVCNDPFLYQQSKVTIGNLSNEKRLCMSYLNLSEDVLIKKSYPVYWDVAQNQDGNECTIEGTFQIFGGGRPGFCDAYVISTSKLNNAYTKTFGLNGPALDYRDFEVGANFNYCSKTDDDLCSSVTDCSFYKDNYYCVSGTSGSMDIYKISKYLDAAYRTENEEILIYDYFAQCSINSAKKEVSCYKDYDNKLLIETISEANYQKNVLSSGKIRNNYLLSKGQIYKHTFKKNAEGNYYWVSSEPVNE